MDAEEFKKEFLEEVKSAAAVSGEGTAAEFAGHMADYLIDTEVLSNFNPAYCKSQKGNRHFRTDGYVFDELDGTMNLIIVDYDPLTPMNENNINSHLVFGVTGHDVVTTVANGRVLMKDRKLTEIDAEKVMADCRQAAKELADRINSR